jgi:hypothetical protein
MKQQCAAFCHVNRACYPKGLFPDAVATGPPRSAEVTNPCPNIENTHDYQLKLIPLVAPPAPLAPLAPPKKTGSSFFPVSVAAHAPSNNDAARIKTAAGQAIPMAEKSLILSLADIFELAREKSIDK